MSLTLDTTTDAADADLARYDTGRITELTEHAFTLIEDDKTLMRALVQARFMRGHNIADMARMMDASIESVAAFESGVADPTLSFVRRYALAAGVLVAHDVQPAGQRD